MRPIPWTSVSEIESGREYLHLITFFRLRCLLSTAAFFRMARKVTAQLTPLRRGWWGTRSRRNLWGAATGRYLSGRTLGR
jgi:hypothetical protein